LYAGYEKLKKSGPDRQDRRKVFSMSMNPRIKNPLILSIVSTVFLMPVMILTMYLFDMVNWMMLAVTAAVYLAVIFLVFFYYSNLGRK
jgi:cation transport ATPase